MSRLSFHFTAPVKSEKRTEIHRNTSSSFAFLTQHRFVENGFARRAFAVPSLRRCINASRSGISRRSLLLNSPSHSSIHAMRP
jgi:hypothetical protein